MSTFINFHDEREKDAGSGSKYQKWEYLTLSDFRSSSCGKLFSYLWLWILAFISIAVAAADTYTAVGLLAFGHWSSQVDPAIPIRISKWIFVACISFSWVLYFYSWQRAIRVIRRRNVVESYLDPLAVTLQSIRDGQGWRRFLVFAALTKSRKGADYVALFSYFQFKGAIRILLAEGPRQVVNALTLYTVMRANLIPIGANAASDGHTPIVQFFYNVKILADEHTQQAAILFSMLFTLVIWVISFLSFIVSCILYLVFLAHYIDGTLSSYCRRKIDKRLEKIVGVKIQKALQKQADARKKAEDKVIALEQAAPGFGLDTKTKVHNVTVKDLGYLDLPLSRRTTETSTTTTSQPAYRPTRQERLAQQDNIPGAIRPGAPTRSATQTAQSTSIDSDERPLLHQAASMGRIPPIRTMSTQSSQSQLSQAYNKSLPMPGSFDPFYSSVDNASSYQQQSYTITLDTFDPQHMPAYQLPARPESSSRSMPARMPSLRDYAAAPVHEFNRQNSFTTQTAPGDVHNIDQASSLYSHVIVDMPNQPQYNDISHTYTPFGNEQHTPYTQQPQAPYTQQLRTPSRAATLPTAPRMLPAALTPPRRVGTAPPRATMRTEPSPVYELDGAQNVDVEGEPSRSRFAMGMGRRRESDEEFGYGVGDGNGYGGGYR